MITFTNVTKQYGSKLALNNVSVNIEKGDFVFLVGPSGAGKSTFIKLILKEIEADKGIIDIGKYRVTSLSKREIPNLRRRIGMVFQDFRLLPKKTVFENVAFAMEILHKSKRQIRRRVPQILSIVGISDKADRYPAELSAGEQQRVAIARAIINNPTVLIADEPTGNLDPVTAREIMSLLEEINATGTTIVMVTHAKDIVDEMNKRVIAIEDGVVVRDEAGRYGYSGKSQVEISGADYISSEKIADDFGSIRNIENTESVSSEEEPLIRDKVTWSKSAKTQDFKKDEQGGNEEMKEDLKNKAEVGSYDDLAPEEAKAATTFDVLEDMKEHTSAGNSFEEQLDKITYVDDTVSVFDFSEFTVSEESDKSKGEDTEDSEEADKTV